MRKTSHDGGDSTSITSGVDNELKKPILSILKPKKNSLKRKPPTCKEVDETVIEPLLSQDREKPGTSQSAKFFTKSKTDTNNDKINDKSKLLGDIQNPISSAVITTANITVSSNDRYVPKSTITAPIHNHMNTNVFNNHDSNKIAITTKSQILVEIDSSKPSGYCPSPLIFTTAKIHADGKTKHMEPVQVTPVPILSTVELSLSKSGNVTTNEKKVSTAMNGTSLMSTVYNPGIISNNENKTTTPNSSTVTSVSLNSANTAKPAVTSQNKTSTTTSKIIDSKSNNLTTSSNEKAINKTENVTSNQKAKDLPILTAVVSTISSTTEQNKAFVSLKSTNPVSETIKPTVSANNQVQPNQSNKQSDKSLNDKIKTNVESTQEDNKMKDSVQANKSNKDPNAIVKPNISNISAKASSGSDNKQLQRQKSIAIENTSRSKIASGLNTSNKVDTTKDLGAKIVSTSAKPISTIQSKITNNTSLSKDKTPKPSANETKSVTSKPLQAKTADSSLSKTTSNTAEKPNINSKTTYKPSNTIPSTSKNDNTISTPNITKNVSLGKTSSNLPKSVTSAITTKSVTVPSTKNTTKVTSVTSQKPQSSTSVTSTKPMGSGKTQLPASTTTASATKTPSVSASSTPVSSVTTSKTPTTRSAPLSSASETPRVSVIPSSTSVTSANGIAKSDTMMKGTTTSNDSKVSKA